MAASDIEPITRADAINLVKKADVSPLNTNHAEAELEYSRLRIQAILEERKEVRNMRIRWSNWILGCIVAIVAVDFLLVGAVGFGWAKFPDGYTLPAFLGESIINIIGLAVIIVRFLFSDKKDLPKE